MAVSRYLNEDEDVVVWTRRHLSWLTRSGLAALAAVLSAASIWSLDIVAEADTAIDLAAAAVAAVFVLRSVKKAVAWWTAEFVATDHRIVASTGLMGRTVTTIALDRVLSVGLSRSVWGRVRGYAHVTLDLGEQGRIVLESLPRREAKELAALVLGGRSPRRPRRYRDPDQEDTGPLPRVVL